MHTTIEWKTASFLDDTTSELRAVIPRVGPAGKKEEEKRKGARAKRQRHLWSRDGSGDVPRACRRSTKICSYEVQVQVQVVPRADLRHFKQLGTKPGGNGGGHHQLRNSAVRDRDGGQGREGRAES